MSLEPFSPENELEMAVDRARQGRQTVEALLSDMTSNDLYISSKSEVLEDGTGFDPLLLESGGYPLVAAFSSLDRPGLHSAVARFILRMSGKDFFLRLPPKYGVILNPGYVAQFIVPPETVAELKAQLKAA